VVLFVTVTRAAGQIGGFSGAGDLIHSHGGRVSDRCAMVARAVELACRKLQVESACVHVAGGSARVCSCCSTVCQHVQTA
jgi:hypothetical protein